MVKKWYDIDSFQPKYDDIPSQRKWDRYKNYYGSDQFQPKYKPIKFIGQSTPEYRLKQIDAQLPAVLPVKSYRPL